MPQDLGGVLSKHLLPNPPDTLGVAVSGGSDSVALLCLLHDFSRVHGTRLHAVTVDHGLRPEAAQEAAAVEMLCRDLDVPHTVLRWTEWDEHGNLQNEARRARYRLMADWARARDIGSVALGHTLDDQAETVLMRLARGAGVDGLSAMTPRRTSEGITWLRPMLDIARQDLRHELRHRNVSWCDDPSNGDTRFDRVRVRQALELLEPLGIHARSLGQVAFNMARARDALNWQAFLAARSMAQVERGAVRINWRGFVTLPDETARRILVGATGWISGAEYAPRRKAVLAVIEALKQGVGATLDGCQVARNNDTLWIFREYHPVQGLNCGIAEIWDHRWRLTAAQPRAATHVSALGAEGLKQVPDWRRLNVPRDVLISTPGVWRGDDLLAAPLAGYQNGWHAHHEFGDEAFFAALLSH